MNIVVAMDSFKGSLSSERAGAAVKKGILKVHPRYKVQVFSLADGGEGTIKALGNVYGCKTRSVIVKDPLGRKIKTYFGENSETGTALIEMSMACGLTLLEERERDVLHTSSRGLGDMMMAALEDGCRNFIIGIGSSATNDGGSGMLRALGYRLLDRNGETIPEGAIGLSHIASIDESGVDARWKECSISVICDVDNPLLGENGCSLVYGPQKGADFATAAKMDRWMSFYLEAVKEIRPRATGDCAGAGAAGGVGFALSVLLGGKLMSGGEAIAKATGLSEAIEDCELVITGEGKLDSQTRHGKAPMRVAKMAKANEIPVIALCGAVSGDIDPLYKAGFHAILPIQSGPISLSRAMEANQAEAELIRTAEQVVRLIGTKPRRKKP